MQEKKAKEKGSSGAGKFRDGGEQFAPRTSRHSRSLSAINFFVGAGPVSDASPRTRAPGGSNPIKARDSIVFPLPDSPTNPSDSPTAMRSDTSFTGRTQPVGVGNSIVRPRTSSRDFMTFMIRTKFNFLKLSLEKHTQQSYIFYK